MFSLLLKYSTSITASTHPYSHSISILYTLSLHKASPLKFTDSASVHKLALDLEGNSDVDEHLLPN